MESVNIHEAVTCTPIICCCFCSYSLAALASCLSHPHSEETVYKDTVETATPLPTEDSQDLTGAHLVCHLQRLPPFDEDTVLGSHSSAHHNGCGRGQPQGAGAGDAQHCDGRLERKADDDLCLRDVLAGALQRGTSDAEITGASHLSGAVGTESTVNRA